MATWAWRCARAGVRRERHWGYFTSGIVLAAHLGKTIAVLYHVATSMTQLYVVNAHVPSNSALQALEPRAWWNPTFHMFILVVVALVVLSRAGRSAPFWIGAGVYNIAIGIMFIGLIIAAGYKKQ
jgi:hypothetical protein